MTSAVEPDYIRCVSVTSQKRPSTSRQLPSTHPSTPRRLPLTRPSTSRSPITPIRPSTSTLAATPFSIHRNRPKTAADLVTSARTQAERILDPDRGDMLDELMFLYGRGVTNSFNFSSPRGTWGLSRSKTSLGFSPVSPWERDSSAALQMHRASSRQPGRRPFPQLLSQPLARQNVT